MTAGGERASTPSLGLPPPRSPPRLRESARAPGPEWSPEHRWRARTQAGDPDIAVEGAAGDVPLALLQTDHLEATAGDTHRPTQRIDAGKELVHEDGADDRDLPCLSLFLLAEEATARDGQIANGGDLRGRADQRRAVIASRARHDLDARIRRGAVENATAGVALEESQIGAPDVGVALELSLQLLATDLAGSGHLGEDERVAAEGAGGVGAREALDTVQCHHHDGDRGHGSAGGDGGQTGA